MTPSSQFQAAGPQLRTAGYGPWAMGQKIRLWSTCGKRGAPTRVVEIRVYKRWSSAWKSRAIRTKTLASPTMGLLILEPSNAPIVPGTVVLDKQVAHANEITSDLKQGKGNASSVILVPQPSEDPNDPLNWPKWKRGLVFYTILFGLIIHGMVPVLCPHQRLPFFARYLFEANGYTRVRFSILALSRFPENLNGLSLI